MTLFLAAVALKLPYPRVLGGFVGRSYLSNQSHCDVTTAVPRVKKKKLKDCNAYYDPAFPRIFPSSKTPKL